MSQSNLIELTCFDPKASVRLTVYADTLILERNGKGESIAAVRFGGYPEVVRAMSGSIYGGASVDMLHNGKTYWLESVPKAYRWQLSHDGPHVAATLMIDDAALSATPLDQGDDGDDSGAPEPPKPRKCYTGTPLRCLSDAGWHPRCGAVFPAWAAYPHRTAGCPFWGLP